MAIVNILAKLPTEIKDSINQTISLRINNSEPGVFIPNKKTLVLLEVLRDTKLSLDEAECTEIDEIINVITNDIIN